MFQLRNKINNFQLRTLIWEPDNLLDTDQAKKMLVRDRFGKVIQFLVANLTYLF